MEHNGNDSSSRVDEQIAIGKIRRPVGLKGMCMVAAFGRTFESLGTPSAVWVGREKEPAVECTLCEAWVSHKGWRCRFEGCESIEDAERLRNCLIWIQGKDLRRLDSNEYYHFELEGMAVKSEAGKQVGIVAEVHNYPSTDAIEVNRPGNKPVVVPLTGGIVREIDRENRVVFVDIQALEELL